ncbi:hypothetical protein SH449x_002711 [Pirellulaceae bacterium SH449]
MDAAHGGAAFFCLVATLANGRVLSSMGDQVPHLKINAAGANVGHCQASRETWKNMGKSCKNWLAAV